MSAPQGMSLKNCRTRAEAVKRFETWLDEYLAEQVRAMAADWSAHDGATCDVPEFLSGVAELRHVFGQRAIGKAIALRWSIFFNHIHDPAGVQRPKAKGRVARAENEPRDGVTGIMDAKIHARKRHQPGHWDHESA